MPECALCGHLEASHGDDGCRAIDAAEFIWAIAPAYCDCPGFEPLPDDTEEALP